ncbi:hypothetical protein ACW7BJ_20145 [Azospirillum argentinense]|uniref:Uncharacterized protein n=1 Tax=Azospirillum argentinense TaxID=2970906 RepID=A0A5B0L0Y3_9PROT|nr:hypothetical protein [Azospirillum argentinense]KAA1058532.1 hypothetical protein FH063_000732 [Azospirillum argentinense]
MASTKRDTAPDPERLIGAWRDAAADARRWRDDPDRVAALRAARTRLHQPPPPPPRPPQRVLADELHAARAAWEEGQGLDGSARALAYANLKRWEPGLFGYSETQRSTAGKIAASEAAESRRDEQERAEAQALIRAFRRVQDRARSTARAVQADPRARAMAADEGLMLPEGGRSGGVTAP